MERKDSSSSWMIGPRGDTFAATYVYLDAVVPATVKYRHLTGSVTDLPVPARIATQVEYISGL